MSDTPDYPQSSPELPESTSEPSTPGTEPRELLPNFGRSFGWMALFLAVFFLAVIVYVIGYGVVLGIEYAAQGIAVPDPQAIESEIQQHLFTPNGIVGVYLTQFFLLIPLVFFAAHFQRQPWRETLAFNRFAAQALGFWLAVWLVFLATEYLIGQVFDIDPGDFMRSLNGSKHLPVTLILIICAPLLEELIFRGYLFKAWRHSRLGLSGTLLLTSVLFTALHAGQYNWVILALIFALSMILGLAREKSGSIWVPIIIHSANNLVAAITVIYLGLL